MKFHYIASGPEGKVSEGNEEAQNTSELLAKLAAKGLRPVSVKQLKGEAAFKGAKRLIGKKITINDKIFLTKYLAIMLQVGIDLFQAVNILLADFEKSSLRAFLAEVRDALKRGQPFYSTFIKYPKYFSPVFINLIKSGEASGNLDQVFDSLSEDLTKEKDLRSKIRSASIYPLLLLVVSFFILLFLTTFALPRLANVFTGGGFDPPLFSRIVFGVGLFINSNILIILGLIVAIVIGVIIFSRSLPGQKFFGVLLVRMPIVRKIAYHLAIQRFASTLSSLLRAGVPIIESIRITADTVGHPEIKDALKRIASQGVAKGVSLGDSFRRESVFPFVVTNLVAISERAGHLEQILTTLSKFYESEIQTSIKAAVSFIEPLLLVFIGAIIGTIALAIIVPVYQLVGQL